MNFGTEIDWTLKKYIDKFLSRLPTAERSRVQSTSKNIKIIQILPHSKLVKTILHNVSMLLTKVFISSIHYCRQTNFTKDVLVKGKAT